MPLLADETVYRSWIASYRNLTAYRRQKVNKYWKLVRAIEASGDALKNESESRLKERSQQLIRQADSGEMNDQMLIDGFALVREVSDRILHMRHYPVQLLGGICLHNGHIAEMATGEGKTLVSTCPAYLNALGGRGVHIVTVNDYLAERDAEQMGKVHQFLGLSVGVITSESNPSERANAYRKSITYATNKELGFDYLRDRLKEKKNNWFEFGRNLDALSVERVQKRDFHYAIVDEVDSILIDEARTPLIIAEAPPVDDETADEYLVADEVSAQLIEDVDYTYERKERKIEWTGHGEDHVGKLLGGRRSLNGHRIDWHEACLRALKAHVLFKLDVDYVIDEGEVVIVDENTGRKMPGRQWEEGLHQAVAAKEKLEIKAQNETLARTTYQVFFNRYEKLSGMTGTVMTDAGELAEIYNTGSVTIPTNRPCQRIKHPDEIYATEVEKWQAVADETVRMLEDGRSVLIGTRSIDKSEILSKYFEKNGIEHVVLNARNEAVEAQIVSEAGKPGRVTISTNMAGRGTDIQLHPQVRDSGGLAVIGTERHESRRIDNQLVGRSGRQGDPGSSKFFVSLEDPLIQRYREKKSLKLIKRYGGSSKPIFNPSIRKFFKNVQLSIEKQHRKVRFQLIKYDRERLKFNQQIGAE